MTVLAARGAKHAPRSDRGSAGGRFALRGTAFWPEALAPRLG